MRSSSMILRKCRIENPASSAAVGMSKNIFVRAGLAVRVSVNIILFPPLSFCFLPFDAVHAFGFPMREPFRKGHDRTEAQDHKYLAPKGLPGLPFFRRMNVELCQEADKQESYKYCARSRLQADISTFM